jgi:alkanesulfonate monooxygenase SsuD/methylene tetrahydromethanopterin reductase-like flavin-dependent oxidoreductase (luciferase family)
MLSVMSFDVFSRFASEPFRLGLLNIVVKDERSHRALWETIELAQRIEGFGYHRYWLAEHHAPWSAHSSPEMLVPTIASRTNRLRVGTAGILLRYYTPIKVADQFLTLARMFPERIELGVAWGPGVVDDYYAEQLAGVKRRLLSYRHFAKNVVELARYIQPHRELSFWVLGSGSSSQELAIRCRANFGFSLLERNADAYGPGLLEQHRTATLMRQSIAVTIQCSDYPNRAITVPDWRTPPIVVSGQLDECVQQLRRLAFLYNTTEIVFVHASIRYSEQLGLYEALAQKLAE